VGCLLTPFAVSAEPILGPHAGNESSDDGRGNEEYLKREGDDENGRRADSDDHKHQGTPALYFVLPAIRAFIVFVHVINALFSTYFNNASKWGF
jgi:hypothetical protein